MHANGTLQCPSQGFVCLCVPRWALAAACMQGPDQKGLGAAGCIMFTGVVPLWRALWSLPARLLY
jgi:hypothetical protein